MSKRTTVEVDGRQLSVSNLDKVLYPAAGFRKSQVLDYYVRIAPHLLPHLRDRPLSMKRYPDGVDGESFFEKRCPSHRPDWVRTVEVWHGREQEHVGYCVIDDLPTLVWVANLASLELHTTLHRGEDQDRPAFMVFDLDPGPPAGMLDCIEIGFVLRELLGDAGLECFPKTSGKKGLHVGVPLNSAVDYEAVKGYALAVAQHLEKRLPDRVVSRMKKDLRGGKVFIDWSQNDDKKTTVSVYSMRAWERPTVSTPVSWDELAAVGASGDAEALVFEAPAVLERVAADGDLWAPVLDLEQDLPAPPR